MGSEAMKTGGYYLHVKTDSRNNASQAANLTYAEHGRRIWKSYYKCVNNTQIFKENTQYSIVEALFTT